MATSTRPQQRGISSHLGSSVPCAVLIDGSALFLAVRTLFENAQLKYPALMDLLLKRVEGLQRPSGSPPSPWVMWTSASPQNQGQVKFLEYAENVLNWEVRRFSPVDSYMVEPVSVLGLSDSRAASRLVRFDAGIAFALGRLAEKHRVVVITDSFALAEPMLRAASIPSSPAKRPVLAFFGRALDARWQRVLNKQDEAPEWIDLEDDASVLFPDLALSDNPPAGRHSAFIF